MHFVNIHFHYIGIYLYHQIQKGTPRGARVKVMIKVTGIEQIAKRVEADNKVKELLKSAKARRLKELIAQGIDKEVAKVMVDVGL